MVLSPLTTRLTSALLAVVLLLDGIAAMGMPSCRCQPDGTSCCCSQTEAKSGSACCCRNNKKSPAQPNCCHREVSSTKPSNCGIAGCSCSCRQQRSKPAVPVERTQSTDNLVLDQSVTVCVLPVYQPAVSRRSLDASSEWDARTALDRCACLGRFTL